MEYEINMNGDMVYVEVTYFYGGFAAKTWGRPEDRYPEEPAEIEYEISAIEVEDEDGNVTELTGKAAEDYASENYGDDLCDKVYAEHLEALRDEADDYY